MIEIDDVGDHRLDPYRAMRGRESAEVLWAEGPTVVERLCTSGLRIRSVLLTPAARRRLQALVPASVPIYVAEQSVVNQVVGFDLHRGAIAVADRPIPTQLAELCATLGRHSRVVVLEGVNDAVNLGAIARTARALGADALLLDPTCADPYYRRSVRVSMGEVFHLPIVRAPTEAIFDRLSASGFDVWALTPRPDAEPIAALSVPERLALVFGAEGPGLSAPILSGHRNVRVPVRADVDSLNVGHAVAAALAVVQSSTP